MKMGKIFSRKSLLRLYAKIVREKADAKYIARGWAIGMFCGCFFPFGIQLLISIPAAFILRGSKIGATLGTLLTNHVTIFFIYPLQCYVGDRLMGGRLSWEQIKEVMANVLEKQSFESLFELGWHLTVAFFIGGAILTAIMTPLTYVGVKNLVIKRRERRRNISTGK
ncbi:MAG: DUF2062 domain-containing protein [Lentisphaerae bacterium]|nr:DUF2062 domain-containing protein [Lentisphaerota bacterium]